MPIMSRASEPRSPEKLGVCVCVNVYVTVLARSVPLRMRRSLCLSRLRTVRGVVVVVVAKSLRNHNWQLSCSLTLCAFIKSAYTLLSASLSSHPHDLHESILAEHVLVAGHELQPQRVLVLGEVLFDQRRVTGIDLQPQGAGGRPQSLGGQPEDRFDCVHAVDAAVQGAEVLVAGGESTKSVTKTQFSVFVF